MPVRPEQRSRYPADWPAISQRIRAGRAGGRCECTGECGHRHPGDGRCPEVHGTAGLHMRGQVVLTVAHLDHTPENCADENLRAMCQRCHLRYDRHEHARNARATREARAREGMAPLFDDASEGGGGA